MANLVDGSFVNNYEHLPDQIPRQTTSAASDYGSIFTTALVEAFSKNASSFLERQEILSAPQNTQGIEPLPQNEAYHELCRNYVDSCG